MTRKPEIQYIGQFYVYGSEAKQPVREPKEKIAQLPMPKLAQVQKIYLDPVAIVGLVVAVVMLFVMVAGTIQIQEAWQEYHVMSDYVSRLKATNADLKAEYREKVNLTEIESTAISMGMVPISELQTMDVTVTVPEAKEEPSALEEAWDDFVWFMEGLFE